MRRIAGSLASLVSLALVLAALVGCTTQGGSRTPATPSETPPAPVATPLKPFAPNVAIVLKCTKDGLSSDGHSLIKANDARTRRLLMNAISYKSISDQGVCSFIYKPSGGAVLFQDGYETVLAYPSWESERATGTQFASTIAVGDWSIVAVQVPGLPAGPLLKESGYYIGQNYGMGDMKRLIPQ